MGTIRVYQARGALVGALLLALVLVSSVRAADGQCGGLGTGFHQSGVPALRDKGSPGLASLGLAATGGEAVPYVALAALDGQAVRVWTEDTGWHTYPVAARPTGVPGLVVSGGELKVAFVGVGTATDVDIPAPRTAYILATGLHWCP